MKKFWISLILVVSSLNLLDAIMTISAVNRGAEESNPLMKYAIENNFFLEFKILTSALICTTCLKINSIAVKVVIVTLLLIYLFVNLVHVGLIQFL